MRQFLLIGVPVLLPLALYLAWFARATRAAQAAGLEAPKLGDVPWPWLVAIGVLLIVSAGTAYVMMGGGGRDGPVRAAAHHRRADRARPHHALIRR